MTTLIWIASSVALVALLAYTVVRVIRGSIRILQDVSDLATTTAQLDNVQATRELEREIPAVLQRFATVRARHSERAEARGWARAARREARLARATALTRADASTLTTLPVNRR
jgi:heme exporter protein D